MLPIIGITQGDPAGIGAEVIVKALEHDAVWTQCLPLVIGDRAVIEDALRFTGAKLTLRTVSAPHEAVYRRGEVNIIDLGLLGEGGWEYKRVDGRCGDASFQYIRRAIELAMAKEIHAVVTAPINKEAIHLGGHNFAGHTEIFAELTGAQDVAMMLTSPTLRVIHVSTHVSMREACERVTIERVGKVIDQAVAACRMLGIESPRVGVAGLNAHCSENGLFGHEEAESIIPAVERAKARGIRVTGPVPPDTIFVKAVAGEYDIVVAMYHDQGHIPLKLSGFAMDPNTGLFTSMSGVNATVGLPIIRTSVDHGTAFDRAGENRANEQSMVEAIEMALQMAKARFGELS